MGKGTGDLYIKCFSSDRIILTKTYSIQDCFKYDIASSSGASDYTANGNEVFSYDSTNSAYKLTRPNNNNGFASVSLNSLNIPNHCRIEADGMISGESPNQQLGIGLLNGNTGLDAKMLRYTTGGVYNISLLHSTKTAYGDNETVTTLTSSDIVLDRWYHYILEIDGTDATFTLKYGDTVVGTVTKTTSVLHSTNNNFAMWFGFTSVGSGYFKNIKVKPL